MPVLATAALRARMSAIPIWSTMNYRLEDSGEGSATLVAPYLNAYDGVFESFHGGLLMTLADTSGGAAVLSRTGPDARITTTDMNIRFLAPCRSDATAHARLIKFGRTMCPVAVEIRDAAGVLVAVAQVNYMRL